MLPYPLQLQFKQQQVVDQLALSCPKCCPYWVQTLPRPTATS
jgi:hypothetical protein